MDVLAVLFQGKLWHFASDVGRDDCNIELRFEENAELFQVELKCAMKFESAMTAIVGKDESACRESPEYLYDE